MAARPRACWIQKPTWPTRFAISPALIAPRTATKIAPSRSIRAVITAGNRLPLRCAGAPAHLFHRHDIAFSRASRRRIEAGFSGENAHGEGLRSEEHTSE